MRGALVAAFGGPENIIIKDDLTAPEITAPNQVLIDVHTAGINPVDTYIRSGVYAKLPDLPYIPGRDGSGVVREVGSEVKHVKAGDRVWFLRDNGITAETTVATTVFPLPDALSFIEGACLGVPYLTAHRALFTRGNLKQSDRVLIHGASGGVGLAACQLARAFGATLVVGSAGTKEGEEAVARNGAHHTVCHRDAKYVEELKKIAPGGFDIIIEMLANANLATDLDLLARGGRVGIVGNQGEITINPRALMQKESSAYGVMLGGATADELASCSTMLSSLFTASSSFRPVCNRVYSLEEFPQSHRDIMDPAQAAVGNRVVEIRK
ncbi:hypothetical protein PRIPAC_84711 [Pristionchus pacificus]|uniref:PKS_ER domain-containing protein n=1 Tax=Pristionchus pacificus TaxID=54126 RepID=A0A2A6BN88_PRIPA|nr:hypothetical protein PRIPAC_84711 [Pristionchus pacificus]|eukprot:PDM67385.1 hypothetical protein PRIPAC_48802 [Pristionchus pacificus]